MSATRPFWLAATALILISLVPFFLVDVPAVSDYPNHLARIFILAHPDDPVLSKFYAPHWTILPNLGFDLLGVGLLKILPVHVGGRILLAMSLIAPVLGVLVYARAAFGNQSMWPLASVLTAFNGIFFLGFLNFLLSVGLAFAAAGAWLFLRRAGRDGACLLMGGLSSALLFLCHIFGLALFALLILCQELARRREDGAADARARGLVLIAGALVPAILLYLLSPLAGHESAIQGWDGKHKLWGLFIPFMTTSKTLTLVTAFAVFSLLILRWRQSLFAPGTRPALIVLAVLYVVAPVTFKGGTLIDIRLSLMMGLLLFAGIDPQLTASWRKWGMATVAFLVALRSLTTGLAWYDHRRDLADLRATLARIPAGALVLSGWGANAETDAAAPARNLPDVARLDGHLGALMVIERKAFWPHLFADPSQQPLALRPPFDRIADPFGDPPAWKQLLLQISSAAGPAKLQPQTALSLGDFHYVLLIDRPQSVKPPPNFSPVRVGSYAALWRLAP